MIPAAGHRARTSYKSDIKIVKLQIDSTGHNGIQKNKGKRREEIDKKRSIKTTDLTSFMTIQTFTSN
jgi:hypothetical protein